MIEMRGKVYNTVCSPMNTMFCLCVFCENADVVKDAETHRKALLSMVTWRPKITLLHTFHSTYQVSLNNHRNAYF